MIFNPLKRFIFCNLLTLTCLQAIASGNFYTEPLAQPHFINTCHQVLRPKLYNEHIVVQNEDYVWETFLNCPGDGRQSLEDLLIKEGLTYEKLEQTDGSIPQAEQLTTFKPGLDKTSQSSMQICTFVIPETDTRIHNYYISDLDISCIYIQLPLNLGFYQGQLNTFQDAYPALMNFGLTCDVTEYHAYLCRRAIFKYTIIDDIPTATHKITEKLLDYSWTPLTPVTSDPTTEAVCAVFERKNETALLMCLNVENERYLCLYIQEKFKL